MGSPHLPRGRAECGQDPQTEAQHGGDGGPGQRDRRQHCPSLCPHAHGAVVELPQKCHRCDTALFQNIESNASATTTLQNRSGNGATTEPGRDCEIVSGPGTTTSRNRATKHHGEPQPESRGRRTGPQARPCGTVRPHVHRAPAVFHGEPGRRDPRVRGQTRLRDRPHLRRRRQERPEDGRPRIRYGA